MRRVYFFFWSGTIIALSIVSRYKILSHQILFIYYYSCPHTGALIGTMFERALGPQERELLLGISFALMGIVLVDRSIRKDVLSI